MRINGRRVNCPTRAARSVLIKRFQVNGDRIYERLFKQTRFPLQFTDLKMVLEGRD